MMIKNIPVLVTSTLVIGLGVFSVKQLKSVTQKNQLLTTKNSYITELETSNESDAAAIIDLRSENETLKEQIIILEDSISVLNATINSLRKTSRRQARTIQDLNAQLILYKAKKEQVSLAIASKDSDSEANLKEISHLKEERKRLLRRIDKIEKQKLDFEMKMAANEELLSTQEMEEAHYQKLVNITNNTQVKFNEISARKKRFGRSLKSIKNKWNYTAIDFQMFHEDSRLINNGNFMIQIIDTDTNEVLASSNGAEGHDAASKNGGIYIQYDGERTELVFFNHEKKRGQNYEVQIYYIDQLDKAYLLRHGIKQFIKQGKTV